MKLTSTQIRALEYVGRNRRMGAKVGSKISRYMVNKLKDLGLVEEYDDLIILTKKGERYFTEIYTTRKYHQTED